MTETMKVRLGSVTILFSLIVVCMAVVAVLAYSVARNDYALSGRFAYHVSTSYDEQNRGQQWLSEVAKHIDDNGSFQNLESLPEGTVIDDDIAEIYIHSERTTLHIVIQARPGADGNYGVLEWISTANWEEDENLNLFQ